LFYYFKDLDLHLCRKRVGSLVVASLHLIIIILDIKVAINKKIINLKNKNKKINLESL